MSRGRSRSREERDWALVRLRIAGVCLAVATCSFAASPAHAQGGGLQLNGPSGYVTFGDPSAADLAQFTIETWFRRNATGTATSTGSGGVTDAIPLVTKGRSEGDGSQIDMNYFLGIRDGDDVLCADFEEGVGGTMLGLNHPVTGVTPIVNGFWHHAAAAYDGTTWRLYLDGVLEKELVVGRPVRSNSIQHLALGTAINSTGVASGAFVGVIDEARVWNYARSESEIVATINSELPGPQIGLVARWGLDEGAGGVVRDSSGNAMHGSLVPAPPTAAWSWASGAPFDLVVNHPPSAPALPAPPDQATGVPLAPTLAVTASDPDGDPLTVSFFGRAVTAAGPDFTIIPIPDTQYYTGNVNGGTPAMFDSQTAWIVSQIVPRNIVCAVGLGDCVENGDNGGNPIEWTRADASYAALENPSTTGMSDGLPYGVSVGNHDQSPIGSATGTTTFYNQYFGAARFQGRVYYGGHYGTNNDNWFELFSASGMDFITLSFEYDTAPDAPVLAWGDSLLTAHANRRAIVVSHWLANTGNPASFGAQGQATYDALKGHSNLFLMLCGHVPGEGRRSDTFNGNTVHTLMSDYQARTNGGNGWLRIMEFSPANNVIRVRTYSPWLDQFEADADSSSQFTIPYAMSSAGPFQPIGVTAAVASGSTATMAWPGRTPDTEYEWYVTVSDGPRTVTGPIWRFRTAATDVAAPSVQVVAPNGGETFTVGQEVALTWTASDDFGVTSVDLLLSRAGPGAPFETIAAGIANSGSYSWTVTGPVTSDGWLQAVARDAVPHEGQDLSDAAFAITDNVGVAPSVPNEFAMGPARPSPSRAGVRAGFALPVPARVRIDVLDVQGRVVEALVDDRYPAGRHDVTWSRSASRIHAGPGLYFMRLRVAGRAFTRRFLLLN